MLSLPPHRAFGPPYVIRVVATGIDREFTVLVRYTTLD
jgi:hypothetical protein